MAKPKYEREGTFLVDNGISINNYFGDMEFMTNMAISKLYGENEANIINKENFYGVYIMPFAIELDRVGVQEIKTVDTKIKDSDTIEEKIKKIYKALNLEDKITDIHIQEWVKIIESIDYDQEERQQNSFNIPRKRRVKELLEGMGELAKRIEGSERNLSPYFSAFSLDYIAPKYMLLIKDYLKKVFSDGGYLDTQDLSQKVQEFAKNEGKEIKTADYYNYNAVVNDLIKEIFKES